MPGAPVYRGQDAPVPNRLSTSLACFAMRSRSSPCRLAPGGFLEHLYGGGLQGAGEQVHVIAAERVDVVALVVPGRMAARRLGAAAAAREASGAAASA